MPAPSVSLFRNASQITLQGNTLNTSNVHNGTLVSIQPAETNQRALDDLLKHCCLGAQVDSNERFDPPRCDPETRLQITQDIMDWVTNDSQQPSILVLHGSAGAGKSALEQTIAQRCQQEGRLASSFFLSRTAVNARRSDGNAVIPTLVYQHIQVFPWLKERVLEEIRVDPGIFERSREVQLDRLLVKHFQAFPVRSNDTKLRLISIDGLDECDDRHVQQDLLLIIAAILIRLRHPFRFFIACRPESHLMQVIKGDPLFRNNRIYCIDLGGDTQVDADIRLFLCNRFRKIRETHPVRRFLPQPWPGESVINKLVVNASGQFIYADTVMRFLESLSHSPEEQLDIILAIAPPRENENPFAQLDALYTHIFSLVEDRDTVWRVLGVIYLAAQDRIFEITKMDQAAIAYPAFLERLFKCRRGTVHLALGELPSVISVVSDNTAIKVLHASLFDFLLDPTRSGPYTLDLALAHESLAIWRYRDINFQEQEWQKFIRCELRLSRQFLRHCQFARPSETVVHAVERVSLLILDFIHAPMHEQEFRTRHGLVNEYDSLLSLLSSLFERKEFPCISAGRILLKIQTIWRSSELYGMDDSIARVLRPSAKASEWNDICDVSGPKRLKRFPSLERIARSLGVIHTQRKCLGSHILSEAKEIAGGKNNPSGDIQRALMAARLFFWTTQVHHEVEALPTVVFPHIAARWALKASDSIEPQNLPSAAALLLFVAALLPYAAPIHANDLEQRSLLGVGTKQRKEALKAMKAFPKTVKFYNKQVDTYLERCETS